MIRNLVFDMGMVLLDYHPLQACRAVAKDEAAAQQIMDALFSHPEWVGLDDDSITEAELARRAMARIPDPATSALVPALLHGMPHNVLSPIPGMAEVLDALFTRGFRIYLLSNAGWNVSQNRDMIPRIARFHGVVFSVEEKLLKPNPALYRRLTDRYGLAPAECLFIDDLPKNVEGARSVGWQAYQFNGDVAALSRFFESLPNP